MGKRDPRVDAYINNAADFAKPILTHLRETVHAAVPDVVEEMKWSFPHFTYKGMLCSMAAFKHHAMFGFWKASLVLGDKAKTDDGMGHLGRTAKIADLPSKRELTSYIRKAAALNDEGVKLARTPKKPPSSRPVRVPPDSLRRSRRTRRRGRRSRTSVRATAPSTSSGSPARRPTRRARGD